MRSDHPIPALIRCGKERAVADLHGTDVAGEAYGIKDVRKGHHRPARHDVLQAVVGKFHGIEGEAVGLGGDGFRSLIHLRLQLFGGQVSAPLILSDVIHVCLQVPVGCLRHGKGHPDFSFLSGLKFISVFVQHPDVKGIRDRNSFAAVPFLFNSGIRLLRTANRNLCNGKDRILREYALIGTDGHLHASHGPGHLKARISCLLIDNSDRNRRELRIRIHSVFLRNDRNIDKDISGLLR